MTDQEYLDLCAIAALQIAKVSMTLDGVDKETLEKGVAFFAYDLAEKMLAERKKRMEGEKI